MQTSSRKLPGSVARASIARPLRVALSALFLLLPATLHAQGPHAGLPARVEPVSAIRPLGGAGAHIRSIRDSVPPNQWKRGALIGGGVGAVVGLAYYALWRLTDDRSPSPVIVIGPVLIGALVGGIVGAFHRR